ncbi:hypothetical protein BGZ83_007971 [Gryganskiella cystojenkinii]|nr:hypothetical protein BGZ83_007971 [Gryganskiella cystojenkinii]
MQDHRPRQHVNQGSPHQLHTQRYPSSPAATNNSTLASPSDLLAIPEILILIGQWLDKRSLVPCIQVCKEWRQVFLGLLWKFIDIAWKTGPDSSTLSTHSSLVHTLILTTDDFSCYSTIHLPSLTILEIDQQWDEDEISDQALLRFLNRHSATIKELTTSCMTGDIMYTVAEFGPQLEKLRIGALFMDNADHWMTAYDTLWSRLRVLSFGEHWEYDPSKEVAVDDVTNVLANMLQAKPTRIQALDFDTPACEWAYVQIQLLLVTKCLELRRLSWVTSELLEPNQAPMALVTQMIQDGRFSRQLEALGLAANDFNNLDLAFLLQYMTDLKELDLHLTNFNQESWRILKEDVPRYLFTLTVLNLSLCLQVEGSIVQDILCSISSLEQFSADYIQDRDLDRDPRPWLCHRLRVLNLTFVRTAEDREMRSLSQPLFLDRVAQLTRLEVLNVDMPVMGGSGVILRGVYENEQNEMMDLEKCYLCHPLQLTLDQGLDRLGGLRELRRLQVPDFDCSQWNVEEARWALKHWVNLRELSGMSIDEKTRSLLQTRVKLWCHRINP